MASEEKIRVNAKIPLDLHEFVTSRYGSITEAIIAGLEKLRSNEAADKQLYDQIEDLRIQIQSLYAQLHTKDVQIEGLNEALRAQAANQSFLVNEIKPLLAESHLFTTKLLAQEAEKPKEKKTIWDRIRGK